MFLAFQKITNTGASPTSPTLINSEDIMYLQTEGIYQQSTNSTLSTTRVEVYGTPKYTFNVTASLDDIASELGVIDVSGGVATTGSSCLNVPGVLDTVSVSVDWPMVKANAIMNNTLSSTYPVVFNPDFIIWAEETFFNDPTTGQQTPCLLIVLRDSPPRQLMTNLAFADLETLLHATDLT